MGWKFHKRWASRGYASAAAFPNRSGWVRETFRARCFFIALGATVMPANAYSRPTSELISSGQLQINISISPRYNVEAVTAANVADTQFGLRSGGFCLTTNASAMALPVMIVRMPIDWSERGDQGRHKPPRAEPATIVVTPCEPEGERANTATPFLANLGLRELVLVTPE